MSNIRVSYPRIKRVKKGERERNKERSLKWEKRVTKKRSEVVVVCVCVCVCVCERENEREREREARASYWCVGVHKNI